MSTRIQEHDAASGWRVPVAIAILAVVVRILGPLREVALGQTDAYAHLQFLNDILSTGRLRSPFYPAGYYWILAGPVRWLRLDPYGVMRYSGALFGLGLVGMHYGLARDVFGRRAALWSAFLVAAFPAFYWLQKTGVGAYPYQLGLPLVLLILLAWQRVLVGRKGWLSGLLAASALLAWSVPMLLLDLLPFLVLDFAVRLLRREIPRRAIVIPGAVAALLAGGIGLLALFGNFEGLVITACRVAQVPLPDGRPLMALLRILGDYVTPQRLWPGGWLVSVASLAVGAALAGLLAVLRTRGAAARMVALWAVTAWLQTVFGVFQFGLYMRAGWPLLMAMAVLGGWLVTTVLDRLPPVLKRIGQGLLGASALVVLVGPPTHSPHLSAAESDLVFAARQLDAWSEGRRVHEDFAWLEAFTDAPVIEVWSRRYNMYPHGEPLPALLQKRTRIILHSLMPEPAGRVIFNRGMPHVVLLDDRAPLDEDFGLMRIVNPEMITVFARSRRILMEAAYTLRQQVDRAEQEGWRVERRRMPNGLEVLTLVFPPSNGSAGEPPFAGRISLLAPILLGRE